MQWRWVVSASMQHETDQTSGTESAAVADGAAPAGTPLDLDGIERDLADVEAALGRLEAGTYWTDEVTGAPLPDSLLDVHPTARRA